MRAFHSPTRSYVGTLVASTKAFVRATHYTTVERMNRAPGPERDAPGRVPWALLCAAIPPGIPDPSVERRITKGEPRPRDPSRPSPPCELRDSFYSFAEILFGYTRHVSGIRRWRSSPVRSTLRARYFVYFFSRFVCSSARDSLGLFRSFAFASIGRSSTRDTAKGH